MNERLRSSSAPLKIGMLLSLLTIVFGFSMGVMFAEFEDAVRDSLTADAQAVLDLDYGGDTEAVAASVRGSLTYFLRAHIHANGLGFGTALLITFLVGFFGTGKIRDYSALLLGIGALGYATYWAITAKLGPGWGGVSHAKEVTGWYGMTTSALYFIGLVGVIYLFVQTAFGKKGAAVE
jgi:hypothetical protein